MKQFLIQSFLFCTGLFTAIPVSANRSYYVNNQTGNDGFAGSRKQPFKSIVKLNQALRVKPGNVFFAGGQQFEGTIKLSNYLGKSTDILFFDSYGKGKAVINAGKSSALQLDRCSYVTIKNLTLKGNGRLSGNDGSGILANELQHAEINNIDASGFLWCGVLVSGGNNVVISKVNASDNGFAGIQVIGNKSQRFNHLVMADCTASNNPGCYKVLNNHSGNGIVAGGVANALIERCEAMYNGWDMPRGGNGPVGIWAYDSDSVVIQYCYSHHNMTSYNGSDGGGFDLDGGVTNSVMQFNYAAFNEGAGYGLFQYASASLWSNNIVRNNLSYNDGCKNGKAGIFLWKDAAATQAMKHCIIDNNIIFNADYGINFEPGIFENFVFTNNLFLLSGNKPAVNIAGSKGTMFVDNKKYYLQKSDSLTIEADNYADLLGSFSTKLIDEMNGNISYAAAMQLLTDMFVVKKNIF